ncbi:MAG: DoxX family protein [Verrucomicrobiota bacterium]|nr:DoxX family protein [Verrucomicrobiota bacterium]
MKYLFQTTDQIAPVILRVFLAVVMFPHGAQKLLGWWGGGGFEATMKGFTEGMGIPAPFALLAIVAEFFGPIALVLGLLTRVAAFGIGTVISVAAIKVALPHGFFMNWYGTQKGEGYQFHLLMLGMSLALMFVGGGRWSLDGWISEKTKKGKEQV